jgi:hypothetical protein
MTTASHVTVILNSMKLALEQSQGQVINSEDIGHTLYQRALSE